MKLLTAGKRLRNSLSGCLLERVHFLGWVSELTRWLAVVDVYFNCQLAVLREYSRAGPAPARFTCEWGGGRSEMKSFALTRRRTDGVKLAKKMIMVAGRGWWC